jgi:hypothetical protein
MKEGIEVEKKESYYCNKRKDEDSEGYMFEPTPGPGKRRVQHHHPSITSKKGLLVSNNEWRGGLIEGYETGSSVGTQCSRERSHCP